MSEFSPREEIILPGEVGRHATVAEFTEKLVLACQEYDSIHEQRVALGSNQRSEECRLNLRASELIGRLRSLEKWADTNDIDRLEIMRRIA